MNYIVDYEVEIYQFDDVLTKVKEYIVEEDQIEIIKKAYEVAKKAHQNQTRKSGEPFILHPIHVAYILAELRSSPEVVAAGFLHDVIEDTTVTSTDIENIFGKTVHSLVDGVTKLDELATKKNAQGRPLTRSETSNDNYQKLILAMVKDVRVVIVKLADRLHNMRTIYHLKPEKQKQIAQETLDILVPLAHRLGMFKIKSELEDRSFAVLNPEGYLYILDIIEKTKDIRHDALDKMIEKISYTLRSRKISFTMKGRVKSVYSMYNKLKKYDNDYKAIYDLMAIRILTDTITDCYAILGYMHNIFTPMPHRIKDYIAVPKPNRYQSLHTTVFGVDENIFEIQIRTYEMDYIAEYGVAAHWAYKEQKDVQDIVSIQKELKLFQDLEDAINSTDTTNAKEFIDTVKQDIFDATVFAFTPAGDVYQLSKGSTPIDFAYKIHTQIGHRMIGAKVNNRMVPISYEIQTGDIVEILTSTIIKPSESWLRIAKSSHAKAKIRSYFKKERRDEHIQAGRAQLDELLVEYNETFENLFDEEGVNYILDRFALPNIEELFSALGQNVLSGKTIMHRLMEFKHLEEEPLEIEQAHKIETLSEREENKIRKKGNNIVEISGATNVRLSLAKCCSPIPGDVLVGYVSKGKGVIVHTADCPQVQRLKERHIDVVWAQELTTAKYIVPVRVMSFDRKGLLSELLQALYKMNTDIIDIQSKVESDNMVYTNIKLTTTDTEHLQKIFVAIKKIPEVYEVQRVYH